MTDHSNVVLFFEYCIIFRRLSYNPYIRSAPTGVPQVTNMRKLMVMVLACVMATSLGGLALALDPLNPSDAKRDDDGDQLSNLLEYMYGTDPLNEDTDADGLPDGYEVNYDQNRAIFPANNEWARFDSDDGVNDVNVDPNYRFDPALKNAHDLADQDGWDTYTEYMIGTDPTNPDTDGDTLRDDLDPRPLIPDGSHSGQDDGSFEGQAQGTGMGTALSAHWDAFVLRGF